MSPSSPPIQDKALILKSRSLESIHLFWVISKSIHRLEATFPLSYNIFAVAECHLLLLFQSFEAWLFFQDVLALCGGDIAPWIPEMIASYKFLFPFDLRRRYFYCTAFGAGRALIHLQNLQAAEGTSPSQDHRAGRVMRSKVNNPYCTKTSINILPYNLMISPLCKRKA